MLLPKQKNRLFCYQRIAFIGEVSKDFRVVIKEVIGTVNDSELSQFLVSIETDLYVAGF